MTAELAPKHCLRVSRLPWAICFVTFFALVVVLVLAAHQAGTKINPFPGKSLLVFVGIFVVNFMLCIPRFAVVLSGYLRYLSSKRRLTGYVVPRWKTKLIGNSLWIVVLVRVCVVLTVAVLIVVTLLTLIASSVWDIEPASTIVFRAFILSMGWGAALLYATGIPIILTAVREDSSTLIG